VLRDDDRTAATSSLPGDAGSDAEADDAIRYYASMILAFQRSAWVFRRDGDLEGLLVDATVVKNRLAPPGRNCRLLIPYPIP